MSTATYLAKVNGMLDRPELPDAKTKENFLYSLISYWQRELNNHRKGRPTKFTPLEINEIISELENRIKTIRQEAKNAKT
jgi:hypothetical protein